MHITISNNIRITGVTTRIRAAITAALTMNNPAHERLKRRGQKTWGVDKELHLYVNDSDGSLVVPRGFYSELAEILAKIVPEFPKSAISYDYSEPGLADFGAWKGHILRGYQEEAIKKAYNGGVLVAPAGSGKTVMGCAVIKAWARPTLWITHTLDLLEQSKNAAQNMLDDVGEIGIIGDGKLTLGSGKLIVATVQTLGKNAELVGYLNEWAGAIVVDEAHHFPANQFIETVSKFKAQKILGLTATPDRKDGMERLMYLGLGPLCHEVQRDGMYESGSIILPEVKFVYTEYGALSTSFIDSDLFADVEAGAMSVDAGGEDMDYLAVLRGLMADPDRTQLVAKNVVASVMEAGPQGGAVIVLGQSIRYLYFLHEMVKNLAVHKFGFSTRTAVIHGGINQQAWKKTTKSEAAKLKLLGETVKERKDGWYLQVQAYTDDEMGSWQVTPTQRKEVIELARNRKIDIIFATSQLVKEGLDIPNLYHGHLVTPMRGDEGGNRTGAGVEQSIGRIMRPDPKNPKKVARWYDYVDFNVGVFNDQYHSRRSVYRRLGLKVPAKPRAKKNQDIVDFLESGAAFGGLPL